MISQCALRRETPIQYPCCHKYWGGGKNLGHKFWGANILGKYAFRQKILKKFLSIISNISDDLFFSHSQLFFYKIDTFHSKCTPLSMYFSFFVSVSAFFHVYFLKT